MIFLFLMYEKRFTKRWRKKKKKFDLTFVTFHN